MADFHQFLVCDAASNWSELPDHWTTEAVERMFIQGDDYVAIGTARDRRVPVVVRVGISEPDIDRRGWDRIIDGELAIPTGILVVSGVTDNELTGGRMSIAPGRYHLRALYAGLDTLSDDGLTGEDRYEVHLWPRAAQ